MAIDGKERFWRGLWERGWFRHLCMVLMFLLLSIPYTLTTLGHFSYDDYDLVVNNPTIRESSGLPQVLASGRPARGLTLMMDYRLFGLDARGYQVMNVVWYLAAAFAFYLLAVRLTGSPNLGWAAGALFAAHPLHAETVMNIAHRKETLAFFFMCLSFHSWLSRTRLPALGLPLAFLFFVLALLSKQVAIVLPVLFAAHWWLDQKRSRPRLSLAMVALMAAGAAALLAAGTLAGGPLLRDFNLLGRVIPPGLREADYASILATSFKTFPQHLRFIFFPLRMSLDHPVSVATFADPAVYLGIIFFTALPVSAYLLRSDRVTSFGILWIFLTILPIMNFMPTNHFLAERYLFIPSAGYCLLLCSLFGRFYRSDVPVLGERGEKMFMFAILTASMFVLLLTPFTGKIEAFWTMKEHLAMPRERALAIAIMAGAMVGGPLLFALQRADQAGPIGKRRWLDFAATYLMVAASFVTAAMVMEWLTKRRLGIPQKDVERAIATVNLWMQRHAIAGPRADSSPFYGSGSAIGEWSNILVNVFVFSSILLFTLRKTAAWLGKISQTRKLAFSLFLVLLFYLSHVKGERALDWSSPVMLWRANAHEYPESATSWNNLGKVYFDRKRYDLAARAFEKTIELDPGLGANHRNLGMALVLGGELENARSAFQKAVTIDPIDPVSLMSLANINFQLAAAGQDPDGYKKAISHYLRVLDLDPRSAHAHHNLAASYLQLGELDKAMYHAMKALAIHPGSEKSRELRRVINEAQIERSRR